MFGKWKAKTEKGDRGEPLPTRHDGNPDTWRPSGFCPRCRKQSSFEAIGSLPITFDGGNIINHDGSRTPTHSEQATVLICRHCEQGVCVLEEQYIGDTPARKGQKGGAITWRGFHWWPLAGTALHPAIPTDIAQAFNEAIQAVSANCPRAGAAMARRTLEAITVAKGESSGHLASRLKRLAENGTLQPTLAEWAKEVRQIGNDGAHFDLMRDVSIEDAKQLNVFVEQIIHYLFIMPHELSERRSRV